MTNSKMETKHSPGPWKAVYRHGGPDYHNIVDANRLKIAEVFGDTNYNGYLIAAAPDMLAALEKCVERMLKAQEITGYPHAITILEARDAIRKAKGVIK